MNQIIFFQFKFKSNNQLKIWRIKIIYYQIVIFKKINKSMQNNLEGERTRIIEEEFSNSNLNESARNELFEDKNDDTKEKKTFYNESSIHGIKDDDLSDTNKLSISSGIKNNGNTLSNIISNINIKEGKKSL